VLLFDWYVLIIADYVLLFYWYVLIIAYYMLHL